MEFKDLELNQRILDAVKEEGYVTPSPIQQQAIPPALLGRDILGCAQTGTGKTAAFAIPIIQKLITAESSFVSRENPGKVRPLRSLILTPTRELALQIYDSFKSYGRFTPLKYGVVMGGVSQYGQVKELQGGLDILIATPGRLLDLLYQGYIEISSIEVFVLDEADRMLDMGFIDDVKKVIEFLPAKRQTMFFTATMPPEVRKLTEKLLDNAVNIAVAPVSSTVDLTTQSVYMTNKDLKQDLLVWYLKSLSGKPQTLVFTRTKYGADKLSTKLNKAGIRALALHGDKSQSSRQNSLQSFKNGSLRVLVATDIAARGIDVDSLPLVINYELPNVPETYVHRIGRTGRAGKEGAAVSFCDCEERKYLKDIEKLINKTVTVVENHPYPMTVFDAPKKERQQNRPRRRFNNNQGQNQKNNNNAPKQ